MKHDFLRVAVACMALTGCGGSTGGAGSEPDPTVTLREIADAYRLFTLANKKPPAKADDLLRMHSAAGGGVGAVKSGDVVARYGATLSDPDEEVAKTPSVEILAYQKQAPDSGGYVLMLDRTVRKMTADEFKAAPKAGK